MTATTIGCTLAMDRVISVGYGDATVTRDGVEVYREPDGDQPPCEACDGTGSIPTDDVMGPPLRTCFECGGFSTPAPTLVYWTVAEAEKRAAADPEHDWRITLFAAFSGEVYQRRFGHWLLIEQNKGIA